MVKSFDEQLAATKMHYQQNTLTYHQAMYVLKKILDAEIPNVSFLPAYPAFLIPGHTSFMFKDTSLPGQEWESLTDTITYTVFLKTTGNRGGPSREPHAKPRMLVPIQKVALTNPENPDEFFRLDSIIYDYTIQFDFFSHTYAHLEKLVERFEKICILYRSFIKRMGASEFLFQARYKDDPLADRYAKYILPHASYHYYLRTERIFVQPGTKFKELQITILDEIERTIDLD